MKEFRQFGIKPTIKKLVGEAIEIDKILGNEIIVEDFRLEDSKIQKYIAQGSTKCLHLQFRFEDKQRITFTSGHLLIDAIQRIPEDGFPFKTTIVAKSKRYEFT